MDTGYDFISPELFNILFFEQKNLVIYPYVDIKHLHSLDCFTVGHDLIDIDSTGLDNILDIVEFETTNSYSQQPTFYYLLNVSAEDVEKLVEYQNIRCVINTPDDVEHLVKSNNYIFYNKKNKTFANYEVEREKLSLEQYLISISQNEQGLLDEILKIKSAATKVFSDINANNDSKNLPNLLSNYDQIYWDKILSFTGKYFNVQIPKFTKPIIPSKKKKETLSMDFSSEYEFILKTNRKIGQKFIQLLHDYRFSKVNPANLELDQLYYPKKLYNYLRNHHWSKGIPQDFVTSWIKKLTTNSSMNENDRLDLQIIFDKLQIKPTQKSIAIHESKAPKDSNKELIETKPQILEENLEEIPSIENFQAFKLWLLRKLDELQDIR